MLNFLKLLAAPEFFYSIIRISAPIIFATLAAIVVEKAGFCNIGLEGLMMKKAPSARAAAARPIPAVRHQMTGDLRGCGKRDSVASQIPAGACS